MPDIHNAIISPLLCFLSTARHSHTENSLISIALSFYNGEKVSESKELLFSLLSEAAPKRREDGRVRSDLVDILNGL